MKSNKLEIFNSIKKMIDSGSTCSEILKCINEQPNELKSLIPREYLIDLRKECGDKIFIKQLMSKATTGSGIGNRGFDDAVKDPKPVPRTIYSEFHVFIISKIEELEKEDQEKKLDK